MDPNRHNLESLLRLPTKRLLNYYKQNNYVNPYEFANDKLYDEHNEFFEEIKKELNKREHIHEKQNPKH